MKQSLLAIFLGTFSIITGNAEQQLGVAFLSVPFETFSQRICPEKQIREEFVHYYDKLMHSLADIPQPKRGMLLEQLRSEALRTLEIKHPLLAQEIHQKITHIPEGGAYPDDIQCLLTRYGAFEQFNKERIRASNTLWCKIKEYTGSFTARALAWFEAFTGNLNA